MGINLNNFGVNNTPDKKGNMSEVAKQTIQQSQIQINEDKNGVNSAKVLQDTFKSGSTQAAAYGSAGPFSTTTSGGISIGVNQNAPGNATNSSGDIRGQKIKGDQTIQQSQIMVNRRGGGATVVVNMPPSPPPTPPTPTPTPTPTPVPVPTPVPTPTPTPTPVPVPVPTPVPPTPVPTPTPFTPTQYYPCIGGPSGTQFMFNYMMDDKRVGFITNDSSPSDTQGQCLYFDVAAYTTATGFNISMQQAYQQGLIQPLPVDASGKPILAGTPQPAIQGVDYTLV
jgi:hypothetical protein